MHPAPSPAPTRAPSGWGFGIGDEIFPGRRVVESLGGGKTYEVYIVQDASCAVLLVAKVLRPHHVHRERARRAMAREAALLQRAEHPVIVRGVGAELDAEHPHILLEHVPGDTLRNVLKRAGRLPVERALHVALHVASALQHLATLQLVHLDVKPGNVVMSAPPRLIDLSIARPYEDAARVRMPIGTDAYMAPEQIDVPARAAEIGAATDVFGLGATLFHAVTGRRPFPRPKGARDSADPAVRWPQIVGPPAPLPRDVPGALAAVLRAMLDPDPRARPAPGEVARGAAQPAGSMLTKTQRSVGTGCHSIGP
jgi:serine/threonine protein kinase